MDYTSAPGYVTDAQGRRQYADRDIPNGVGGTSLLARDRNAVTNTLMAVLKAYGITPDPADDTLLAAAIAAAVETETVRATAVEATLLSQVPQASSPWVWYLASTNLVFPVWASRFEGWWTGAGSGAAGCQATSLEQAVSGPGGGSGGSIYALIAGKPGDTLGLTAGSGGIGGTGGQSGTPAQYGGNTTCYLNGVLLFSAAAGVPGVWTTPHTGAGGAGGLCTIQEHTPLLSVALFDGSFGSDGQAGNLVFSGNGGSSIWGGSGRAGSGAGNAGTTYGGGGGGAYDPDLSGTPMKGGDGHQGFLLGRFLP